MTPVYHPSHGDAAVASSSHFAPRIRPSHVSATRTMVFIDTSSFLASCWNGDDRRGEEIRHDVAKEKKFWEEEIPRFTRLGRIILPRRNYEELVKLSKARQKPDLADRSSYVLDKLTPFIGRGTIEIVGDENDPFADAILLSVALKFRTQHNLLFITQDRALARDLQRIVEFESVQPRGGQELKIHRISRTGRVQGFGELVRTELADRSSEGDDAEGDGQAAEPESGQTGRAWWQRLGVTRE